MVKNMSKADGIVRIIVALAIAGLWYAEIIAGTLLIVLGVVAAIFIITGFISFCPLYAAFGLRTRAKKKTT
ncbi:MAG: DUF2892 domain-containing protein [Roseivirga sp.]|nr:DUF2892 domain-containing protein [Roseivirga sp.]